MSPEKLDHYKYTSKCLPRQIKIAQQKYVMLMSKNKGLDLDLNKDL